MRRRSGVLRVAALQGLLALGAGDRGAVLDVGNALAVPLLASEAHHRLLASAGEAAVGAAAAVVGEDDALGLGAADPLDLDRRHVGGAKVLLLAGDVAWA